MYQQILLSAAPASSIVATLNSVLLIIVTTILGLGTWLLQRKLTNIETSAKNQDLCLDEKSLLDMETTGVLLELSIVTGVAVREGTCNGKMADAIADAERVQAKRESFLERMANEGLKRK